MYTKRINRRKSPRPMHLGGIMAVAVLSAGAPAETHGSPITPAAAMPASQPATAPATAPKLSIDPSDRTATAPATKARRTDDIFNMSLEDLMNIEVVSGARSKQRYFDVPDAVSVIIPAYCRWDASVSGRLHENFTLAVGVWNRRDDPHAEARKGIGSPQIPEVPRTVILQLQGHF